MAKSLARNFGLDVLRAAAILLVLANHAFLGFILELGHAQWGGPLAALSLLTYISLDWLFVLSGFLIGTMMIRSFETQTGFARRARDFWLRRWFRTLPNYYLFLLVNILLVAIGVGQGTYSVKHAYFLQNLAWREPVPFFYNEAWSLAVDEWFYLVMPILVGGFAFLFGRSGPKAFGAAALTLIVLPMVARWFAEPPLDLWEWDERMRRVTIYRLDATGWGVLAAILNRWQPGYWQHSRVGKAILGLALMAFGCLLVEDLFFTKWFLVQPQLANVLRLTLPAAGTFLALPWIASMAKPAGRWVNSGVERLSQYSYSIYLCHIPLLYLLRHAMDANARGSLLQTLAQIGVWFALTFALAAATHHAFEKPVSDIRERFTRRVDASPFEARPPATETRAGNP